MGFVFGDVCRAQNCPQSDNIRRKPNSTVKPNHTPQAYSIAAQSAENGRIFTAKMLDKARRLLYNTKAVKKKTLQKDAEEPAPGLETIMAKDLHITFLLDIYVDMLTYKQREVVECYYNEDLSLAEIAEVKGITRQGVRDAIKRAEQQLLEMEERLGLAKRFRKVQEELTAICDRALQIEAQNEENGGDPVIRQNVEAILASAKELVD